MLNWLTIAGGIVCGLWALQQLRMTLIYTFAGPQPDLIRIALLDALKSGAFALVLFLVKWPSRVTFLLAVQLIKVAADLVLDVLGFDSLSGIQLTEKGRAFRARILRRQLIPCALYLIAVLISWHFLGP